MYKAAISSMPFQAGIDWCFLHVGSPQTVYLSNDAQHKYVCPVYCSLVKHWLLQLRVKVRVVLASACVQVRVVTARNALQVINKRARLVFRPHLGLITMSCSNQQVKQCCWCKISSISPWQLWRCERLLYLSISDTIPARSSPQSIYLDFRFLCTCFLS